MLFSPGGNYCIIYIVRVPDVTDIPLLVNEGDGYTKQVRVGVKIFNLEAGVTSVPDHV